MQRINLARRITGLLPLPVALLCAMPARPEQFLLDKIDLEIQATETLCWDAVSVMALQAFKGTSVKQYSQQEILEFFSAEIRGPADRRMAGAEVRLTDAREACAEFACADIGTPWLYGLHAKEVPAGNALVEETFVREIAERKTPVIIEWDFSEVDDPNLPGGNHFLIVTGYDDTDPEHRLRVYDPWPTVERAEQMAEQGLEPLEHVKWISYGHYVNPASDHGIKPAHGGDLYKMRKRKGEPMAGYPSAEFAAIPQQVLMPAQPIDFLHALNDADPEIRSLMRDRRVMEPDGSRVGGTLRNDDAIPIVALSMRDLRRAEQRPQVLLDNRTNTLLVPVLAGERVVDSFLMLHGPAPEGRTRSAWHEGGYANNRVAALATRLRREFASPERPPSLFYLVAIPQRATFFLAVGFGEDAEMVSLNNGGRDGMRPADELLRGVIETIKRRPSRPDSGHDRNVPPP